jgi:hypothetical protein
MKVTCLLFLSLILPMSWAALMPGTSYAATSHQTSAESSATTPVAGSPSKEQRYPRHASDKNHPRSRASLTGANHPNQLPNGRKRSMSGNAASLHQPGSGNSGAAKGGLIQNEKASNAMPVRPRGTVRPTAATLNPSFNNVRHRGPNSAVVGGSAGGSANLNSSNTGAINGTRMHRKP